MDPSEHPAGRVDKLLLHIVTTVEWASRSAWLHSLRASILRARSGPVGLRAYHALGSRGELPLLAELASISPSDERRVLSGESDCPAFDYP